MHAHLGLTANYDNAMRAVAFTELAIMLRVAVGALTFRISLISPVIYAHFLRQRYYQSAFTRHALAQADAQVTGLTTRPGIPPVVGQVWQRIRGLIGAWAGGVLQAPGTPNANAGAARR